MELEKIGIAETGRREYLIDDTDITYYPMPDTLDGYCVVDGDTIYLSAIMSKDEGKGNFRKFLDEVENKFNTIKVPTPSTRMVGILTKRGYVMTQEAFEDGLCDVMLKRTTNGQQTRKTASKT